MYIKDTLSESTTDETQMGLAYTIIAQAGKGLHLKLWRRREMTA